MLHRVLEWIEKTDQNKLIAALTLLVVGILLRDLLPYLLRQCFQLARWIGKKLGGRLSYRYIEKNYLNWLVTELRELKLAGVVGADAAKKPKLEQVFVSLRIGEQESRFSVIQAAQAIADEIDRTKGRVRGSIVRGLKRDLEQATPVERKDAERILASHLRRFSSSKLLLTFRRLRGNKNEVIPEEVLVQKFLSSGEPDAGTSSDYAAVLLHKTLNDFPRLAILGAPGAGKTTLLQYIGLAYAKAYAGEKKLREPKCHRKRLAAKSWKLPIFIPLGTIAKRMTEAGPNGKTPSIIDAISLTLPPDLEGDARTFFLNRLRKGRCVVLLDGLDEVPTDEEFRAVVRAIESLAVNFPKNQFIVTSRVAGWRTGVQADFKVTYVSDLTDDQVEFFVDTWCSAIELNSVVGSVKEESRTDRNNRERRARKRSSQLKTALRENPGIRQLATNPMLLSIIALVHHTRASLPQDRSKLYADCSKILLERWDIVRGLHVDDTNLKFDQKEAIMRRLAFALHTGEIGRPGGGREANRDEVEKLVSDQLPQLGGQPQSASHLLQILIDRSGLLIERRRDVLAFAHLTFQEYFTARYLSRGDREEHRDFLLRPERVSSDWWRETILLYSGMLNDSSEFVRSLREQVPSDITRLKARLCGWCLGEAVQVKQQSVRQMVAEDLLRVRTRESLIKATAIPSEVVSYLIRWSKGEEWYTNAIISSIRAATPTERVALMDDVERMLQSSQIELLSAALRAFPSLPGTLRSGKVANRIPPLMSHQNPEVQHLALAAVRSLEKATIAATALKILAEKRADAYLPAIQLCRSLGEEIQNDNSLLQYLNEFGKQPISSWRTRQEFAAVFPLFVKKASQGSIQAFLGFLSDEDDDVRKQANKSLKQILSANPDQTILSCTKLLLNDPSPIARQATVEAMSNLDHGLIIRCGILPEIFRLLGDKTLTVSTTAIEVLKKLSGSELLASEIRTLCLANLKDPDKSSSVISVLASFQEDKEAATFEKELLMGLQSRNARLRRDAVTAVGTLQNRPVSQHLVLRLTDLTDDRDKTVRASAILSLASVQSSSPAPTLVGIIESGLGDRDDRVKTACCKAAGMLKVRNEGLIVGLLEILKRKPRLFSLSWLLSARRLLRSQIFYYSYSFEHAGQNYWKAAAASLSQVNLKQPDEIISTLSEMATDVENGRAYILPYLVDSITAIGSKYRSLKALSAILAIAKHFSEIQQRTYPISLFRAAYIVMDPAYFWGAQTMDLGEQAATLSRILPAKDVLQLFKRTLDEAAPGPRLLIFEVAGALGAGIMSELYPYVLKHLTDEDDALRRAAWKVVEKVNVARGIWEIDSTLYHAGERANSAEI
jgi:HEAT repeat protein